jgi:hypothetical protein
MIRLRLWKSSYFSMALGTAPERLSPRVHAMLLASGKEKPEVER